MRSTLELAPDGDGITFRGTLRVPSVERWWPHTHGVPALHDVRLVVGSGTDDDHRSMPDASGSGRSTAGPRPTHDIERDGLDLHVNGVRTFARGALWTPTRHRRVRDDRGATCERPSKPCATPG